MEAHDGQPNSPARDCELESASLKGESLAWNDTKVVKPRDRRRIFGAPVCPTGAS